MASGIRILESESQNQEFCVPCLDGKLARRFNKKSSSKATRKLERIHSDLSGPFQTTSISGNRYFILYIDDSTRMTWVSFLKTKEKEEVLKSFKIFKAFVEKEANLSILRFRSDNGTGEYNNQLFKDYLLENGISFDPSAPYTQNQNGVSERAIRTITERARSMLSDAGLSEGFWEEAVHAAVYLKNRSPTRAVNTTPIQAWSDKTPTLDHLRSFGCNVYSYIPSELRTKWKPKAKRGIFLGYNDYSENQHRVWSRHRIVIVARTHIRF